MWWRAPAEPPRAPRLPALDPTSPDSVRRLLAEAGPLTGLVHLLGLELGSGLGSPGAVGAEPAGDDPAEATLHATGALLHLVQAGAGLAEAPQLWVVTRGARVVTGEEPPQGLRPRAAGLWGLASVASLEHPELRPRCVDLDPAGGATAWAELADLLLDEAAPPASALRDGARWVPRLERRKAASAIATDGARRADASGAHQEWPRSLEVARPGTLDGLELVEHPREALRPGEVRLRVLAAGLNFRDVLLALGMYPGGGFPLGAECAGVVIESGAGVRSLEPGARVFGFAPGSMGTEVAVPAAFLAKVPPGVSDEEAAGLAVAFLTADHGLRRLARLRAGERVLIHAAAGGVGLAAVQLAQRCDAEVIATAGSARQARAPRLPRGAARLRLALPLLRGRGA